MSAFVRYSNYINSGENLPANTALNFAVLISEGRSASLGACKILLQWAALQNGWNIHSFLNAFCKSYTASKKMDGFMKLLKCFLSFFNEANLTEILNSIIYNWFTSTASSLKTSSKTVELLDDLFLNDVFGEETFIQIFMEICKQPMPDSRKTSMLKKLLPQAVIVKLKETGSDISILLVMKSIIATLDEGHEIMEKTFKSLVKCGLFYENDMDSVKQRKFAELIRGWCINAIDLESCLRKLQELEITNDDDAVFVGYLIFKYSMSHPNYQENLAVLVKHLKEGLYKDSALFMKVILDDFVLNISEKNLLGMTDKTFDAVFLLLGFIATLFVVGAIGDELVIHCLEHLHRPESWAELANKHIKYPEYKKSCFVSMFQKVQPKLDLTKICKIAHQQHDFSIPQMDALCQKIAQEQPQSAGSQENSDDESQKTTTQPKTSKKRKSKKNRKNSESSDQTRKTFSIDEVEDIEKLKEIAALVNNESKLEAFIKAVLQKPSTETRHISSVVKLIENFNSIYESTAGSCIDFANVLTSALDQTFAATKESKLDEETKTKTERLAVVYAEAYKLNLISNTKFTAFLHQKRLKELSVDTLAKMSSSIGTRLHLESSLKVQRAADNLENLIKAAQKTNIQAIHNGLGALSDLLDDLF